MKVYYYVDKNRTRQGPILVNDLVMFDVSPNTLVWCKGMDKWKHAEEVEELAFLFVNLLQDKIHLKIELFHFQSLLYAKYTI